MKKAALYVRVSTAEQRDHGLSVDSQVDALQTYCKENGYEVYGLYNDAGISARKTYRKRPALLRMIADCQARKIDIVLFTKLDRFFRSVPDYYACIEQMNGVPWRAIWEDYETETSAGVFKVNIMLSVAQSEADRTSERIKAVNEFRRARGDYVGTVPVGYKRQNNSLVIDEATKEGVQALFDGYLSHKLIRDCMADAQKHGVVMHRRTLCYMLKNPVYYGDAHGTTVPAYITKEQHDTIVKRMAENIRQSRRPETVYLFRGLCRCGYCGHKMVAPSRICHSEKRGDYVVPFYKCPRMTDDFLHERCEGGTIGERFVEAAVLRQIEPALLEYNERVRSSAVSADLESILATRKALSGKLSRLADLYEDGLISREEYRQKKDALREELSRFPEPETARVITLAPDWRSMYDQLTREGKRDFWSKTIKEIRVYRKHRIEIVL